MERVRRSYILYVPFVRAAIVAVNVIVWRKGEREREREKERERKREKWGL